MTIHQFKANYASFLKNSPSPSLDIDVLLMYALNMDRTSLLLNRNYEIPKEKMRWLLESVTRRWTGFPIAYITGYKEFYGYDFAVTPDVLIPKPDTEILVERALQLLKKKILLSDRVGSGKIDGKRIENADNGSDGDKDGGEDNGRDDGGNTSDCNKDGGGDGCAFDNANALEVCDMCAGSGCIALSVFRSLIDDPSVPREKLPSFTLCDISEAALCVAKKNALSLIPNEFINHIRFCRSDLFCAVPQKFSAILSNPPYIPHDVALSLLSDGRREPLLALDGDAPAIPSSESSAVIEGDGHTALENKVSSIPRCDGLVVPRSDGRKIARSDGLAVPRRLLLQAAFHLDKDGFLLMECGEYNIRSAADFAARNAFSVVRIHSDLEGQERVLELSLSRDASVPNGSRGDAIGFSHIF